MSMINKFRELFSIQQNDNEDLYDYMLRLKNLQSQINEDDKDDNSVNVNILKDNGNKFSSYDSTDKGSSSSSSSSTRSGGSNSSSHMKSSRRRSNDLLMNINYNNHNNDHNFANQQHQSINEEMLISCYLNGLQEKYKISDDSSIFKNSNLRLEQVVEVINGFYQQSHLQRLHHELQSLTQRQQEQQQQVQSLEQQQQQYRQQLPQQQPQNLNLNQLADSDKDDRINDHCTDKNARNNESNNDNYHQFNSITSKNRVNNNGRKDAFESSDNFILPIETRWNKNEPKSQPKAESEYESKNESKIDAKNELTIDTRYSDGKDHYFNDQDNHHHQQQKQEQQQNNNNNKNINKSMITAYASTSLHRGLENKAGENNCFLNVTIQALWHLGPFRLKLKKLINNYEANIHFIPKGGLLDSLCNLFIEYEFTDQDVLPPYFLRECLGKFSQQFELGKIADANEVFDTILNRIHIEQNMICPSMHKCISHDVFGGSIMEQSICSLCGASSEPYIRTDFIICIQSAQLLYEAKNELNGSNTVSSITSSSSLAVAASSPSSTISSFLSFPKRFSLLHNHDNVYNNYESIDFGLILSKCMKQNLKSCPDYNDIISNDNDKNISSRIGREIGRSGGGCLGKAVVSTFNLEPPLAIPLSIGWTSSSETIQTLTEFFSLISYRIKLSDLFQINTNYNNISGGIGGSSSSRSNTDKQVNNKDDFDNKDDDDYIINKKADPSYLFRGMVCYYGLHYISIFYSGDIIDNVHNFLLFDDHTIKDIGEWVDVKDRCIKSRYQPVLLLYELEK